MLKQIEKLLDKISFYGAYGGVISLVLMCMIMGYEMIARKFFGRPTGFADEIAAYLLVVLFFLGVWFTFNQRGHISVKVLLSRLSSPTQRKLEIFTDAVSMVFLIVITREGFLLFRESYKYDSKSMSILETLLFLPQVFVVVGLFLFLACFSSI
ncbi:MAG: TRAP transporter small permease [Deltaproteobacteria bacterium]|nr:TRAP transporter small permease [Deltaproteobacteria bacterium]